MRYYLGYDASKPEISGLETAKKMKQFVVDFYAPGNVIGECINKFCLAYNCTALQISATNKGDVFVLMRWN